MRYLSMIHIEGDDNPQAPSERLIKEMGVLLEEITKAGVMLDTAGLRPPSEGTVLRLAGGRQTVVDGPYTEGKEYIGGYALMEVKSHEEAVEWSRRFLEVHGDEWTISLELRRLDEAGPEA
ncbi:YciI family protein [Phaeacidiphilus oryzae]|uniref:YciI family protein n=1 Tax=Phaeacidiphilus oryzae TaxID=348818 RepID=UPI0005666C9C|nr:YciI family protein [Phaeacidiphilus oryzae]